MPVKSTKNNLTRDTLRKVSQSASATTAVKRLAELRLLYSEDHKLLTGYINQLVNVNRVYPHHQPTQASFRWRTSNPPITNWPRACISPDCIKVEHEWTEQCWSVRDILLPDGDEILITWDHDNIEGKIHDLIVNDQDALDAHRKQQDLHTITCCHIFNYDLPINLVNPHTSLEDAAWRAKYNWQGKDTKQRVLAKNFNHGSKYTKTWRFVYRIQGIEKYGVQREHLGQLARNYIKSKEQAWQAKLDIMTHIQRAKIARTLYGGRRVFYNSSEETGREGFSHMISGTVSDYNNITLILLEQWLGDDVRLLHNAHDGDKIAVKRSALTGDCWTPDGEEAAKNILLAKLKEIIERDISYQGRTLTMTAGVKVYE